MSAVGRTKVIGFDAWTRGLHHYQRLVPACRERGIDLVVVHVGSMGDEPGRPAREVIGGLEVRDIRYYADRSYPAILEVERPDAVIVLSTASFSQRAFLRYCRQKRIPTVHVFHGIQLVWNDVRGALPPHQLLVRLWALRRLLGKQLRYFWPIYARALRDTGASRADWVRFVRDVLG